MMASCPLAVREVEVAISPQDRGQARLYLKERTGEKRRLESLTRRRRRSLVR